MPFRCSRRSSSPTPELESLGTGDYCLRRRQKTVLAYTTAHRDKLGSRPQGAAAYERPGIIQGPEGSSLRRAGSFRGSQMRPGPVWTQVALPANEQWNESSDESELPRRVMLQLFGVPVRFLQRLGVDCLKVEP